MQGPLVRPLQATGVSRGNSACLQEVKWKPFFLLFRLGFSQLLVPCFLLLQRERVFYLSRIEVLLQEVVRLAQILIYDRVLSLEHINSALRTVSISR